MLTSVVVDLVWSLHNLKPSRTVMVVMFEIATSTQPINKCAKNYILRDTTHMHNNYIVPTYANYTSCLSVTMVTFAPTNCFCLCQL